MSITDPTVVTPPSQTALNAGSLTRLAAALLAGYLAKLGLDGNDSAGVAGGIIAIVTAGWHLYKNRQVGSMVKIAAAAPAQRVVALILLALLVVGVVAPGLTACNSPATVGLTPSLSSTGQIAAAKLEYTAETTFNVAGNAYLAAEPYLSPALKVQVKGYLATAYTALQAARAAEVVGDTATIQAKIDAIESLASSVKAITAPATPKAELAPPILDVPLQPLNDVLGQRLASL